MNDTLRIVFLFLENNGLRRPSRYYYYYYYIMLTDSEPGRSLWGGTIEIEFFSFLTFRYEYSAR